jgi:hypothetical protein
VLALETISFSRPLFGIDLRFDLLKMIDVLERTVRETIHALVSL